MSPRISIAVVLMVALAIAVGAVPRSDAASGSSAADNQTVPVLRVAFNSTVSVLDQARQFGGHAPNMFNLGLEQVMTIGPDGSLRPNLARSVSRPSPTTYDYHLRRGVKFWDGNELTAADVENAMNYYRYPGAQASQFYSSVRSIKAIGRYTVRVTLKRRDASWQYVPAFAAPIFEKRFQQEHGEKMGQPGVLTMGTGPWKFDSLDPTRGAELSANTKWWRGTVPIRHISAKFITDPTAQALAFRAGEFDVAPQVADRNGYQSTSGKPVNTVPSCLTAFIGMNTKKAPWNDIHVRRAVAYSINRSAIVAAAYPGAARPVTTMISPLQLRTIASGATVNKLLKSLPSYPFSLTKAREELRQSAYPDGFTASLTTTPLSNYYLIAQVMKDNLAKIGIKLDVTSAPFSQIVAETTGPRDKIGIMQIALGCLTPDPSYFPNAVLGSWNVRAGTYNIASYSKPAVDNLLKAGVATNDSATRLAVYGRLLRILATDVPYVPIAARNASYALSSNFVWPAFSPFTFSFTPWALGIKPR